MRDRKDWQTHICVHSIQRVNTLIFIFNTMDENKIKIIKIIIFLSQAIIIKSERLLICK